MIQLSTRAVALMLIIFAGAVTADAATVRQTIGVKTGMQFVPPRFTAAPGDKIVIQFENPDEMAHNLQFVKPGKRMPVVTAALLLGPDGLNQGFIPKSPDILAASKLLNPGGKDQFEFTAPTKPGVYPYVCTFPGHGLVMYGALYVGTKMPALADDPNIPPQAKMVDSVTGAKKSFHAWGEKRPLMYRIFMPDAGPAAIAVALANNQAYCWDAGQCRLRYAWSGEFLDPWPVWRANGNGLAKVLGKIYWRGGESFPLRIGRAASPAVQFKGYRMLNGYPEFRYTVNRVEVSELIMSRPMGDGLVRKFTIGSTDSRVQFIADTGGGIDLSADKGEFKNGRLAIDARFGAELTITMARAAENGGAE